MREIIGIAGGMGAYACGGLFMSLLHSTKAIKDQDFPEVILHNNPLIPDRSECILSNGESPIYELLRSIQLLEKAGANKIIIACVTAHLYYEQLKQNIGHAELVNVIEVAVDFINRHFIGTKKVGILCSQGAISSGVWREAFKEMDVSLIFLDMQEEKKYFNNSIYGERSIKAGYFDEHNEQLLKSGIRRLKEKGAEVVLGACSELQLVLKTNPQDNYYDVFEICIDNILNAINNEDSL